MKDNKKEEETQQKIIHILQYKAQRILRKTLKIY